MTLIEPMFVDASPALLMVVSICNQHINKSVRQYFVGILALLGFLLLDNLHFANVIATNFDWYCFLLILEHLLAELEL